MTLRAILIGVAAAVAIATITPYNDFYVGNTFFTGTHFPVGPFFILLLLTLVVNVLLRALRRSWALRHPELMLIWCMMIVASTVPASGLMRYWFSLAASPSYYAQRADLNLKEHVLEAVPEDLVVSKDSRSVAVRRFYEGPGIGEEPRIYLSRWMRPIIAWSVFIGAFYLATFFAGGILRRQWVERERLIFPLAKVPLELTEESGVRLLPPLLSSLPFLVGAALTLAFALARCGPVIGGAEQGWIPRFNLQAVLVGTPLATAGLGNAYIYPIALGVAFLVPADVALSIWLFFMFSRVELLVASSAGSPLPGGTYGPFMAWQQAGAFLVFSVMLLWMARRHLATVLAAAFGRSEEAVDADEPIRYRVAFWGLVACAIVMLGWLLYYSSPATVAGDLPLGTRLRSLLTATLSSVAVLAMMASIALVHARLVSQGGIFFTQQTWVPPDILHSVTAGRALTASAAVVTRMVHAILTSDAREILSGHAANALRISSVFRRRRRWFLPVMLLALAAAMLAGTWATLRVYYGKGGLNTPNVYGTVNLPVYTLRTAHQAIESPATAADPHFGAFALGGAVMFAATAMRAHFPWWPVHSLGFLMCSSYPAHHLWLSFLLGWLAKRGVLAFGSGRTLRQARRFWMGVIIAEASAVGLTTIIGLWGVRFGPLFLPP